LKFPIRKIIRPVLLVLLLQAACNRPSSERQDEARAVVDDLGRRIGIGLPARRIVSLAPSLTEMLFALGADERVVGVTSFCDFPPAAARKTVVGDLVTPDVERILALKPDLVLISVEGNSQHTFTVLENLGVRLFVSNPRDIDGVYKSLRDFGALVGASDRATRVIDSLRRLEQQLRKSRPARRANVLMLLSLQPLMSVGSGTFVDEVIALAGGRNAAAEMKGSYPTLNREILLRMNPDIVLYPDDMGVDEEQLRSGYPEWRELGAMRRGAVHRIDADLYLRPGPRVFQAAAELRELLTAIE
jgi:iron complex transport system substrate-binding protein